MSKIIPIFYLPKKYPEDMKLLVEGLVANDGQALKSAVLWLQGKLLAHEGRRIGSPMSDTSIKNYLAGFYVLDLFKANNNLYSEVQPLKRASVPLEARIEVIKPLRLILKSQPIESFTESFTQICLQYSQIIILYNIERRRLQEKHELSAKPKPAKLQHLLQKYCGYTYVGHPGVGYLDMFYRDKVRIDNYLNLLEFMVSHYGKIAEKTLGLIPIVNILNHLVGISDYRAEDFKQHLIQLQLTHRIELMTTKSQMAKNMGLELFDIRGVKYGFVKIVESAIAI